MNTKEAIERMQSIIDCFEVCHVHKKDIYVPLDVEDVEALWMAVEALKKEPCEDCISRQAVNELVDELARAISDERCCISRGRSTATIMRDIRHLPPVTPAEKVGRWITQWNVAHQKEYYYCSECREEFSYDGETGIKMNDYRYCPNCGAKMEVEE